MFFNGYIRITWLSMDILNGIVGVSKGLGEPADFEESNMDNYTAPPTCAEHWRLFD